MQLTFTKANSPSLIINILLHNLFIVLQHGLKNMIY